MINEQALKDRLRVVAKEKNIHFNACWKQLLLERFLARLASSVHSSQFIFKGGLLLAYLMEIGRETTDLDFSLTRIHADESELKKVFEEIISVHLTDGFRFSLASIELLNQPHMDYPGYRVVLNVFFNKMRDKIQVDVGVGDIVEPLSRKIPFVQYRGEPFFERAVSLFAYPAETIFAEKLETIISKGAANSRMKDYHDLILLMRTEGMLSLDKLQDIVRSTFSNRGTAFSLIAFEASALKAIQRLWTAHLQGLGEVAQELNLPKNIMGVIDEVNSYITIINSFPIESSPGNDDRRQ